MSRRIAAGAAMLTEQAKQTWADAVGQRRADDAEPSDELRLVAEDGKREAGMFLDELNLVGHAEFPA